MSTGAKRYIEFWENCVLVQSRGDPIDDTSRRSDFVGGREDYKIPNPLPKTLRL